MIGGGFDVYDSNLTVAGTTFNKMVALTGAAIDLDCQGGVVCNFLLQNLLIKNCRAVEKGGGINYDRYRPSIVNVTY